MKGWWMPLLLITSAAAADMGKKEVGPLEGSYAKCLLDKMPGVANDTAAYQIARQCLESYPDAFDTVESGSALFGFSDGGTCIAKKARDTQSAMAARLIVASCIQRYGPIK